MRRTVLRLLLVGHLALLFGLTLGGFYQPGAAVNLVPFASIAFDLRAGGRHLVINFLGNLAAFLPVGVLVPMLRTGGRPASRVAVASLGVSLLIEFLQGISGRRVADVDDVILNVAGGMLGYGLWQALRGRGGPAQKA